jgi:dimethylargininase
MLIEIYNSIIQHKKYNMAHCIIRDLPLSFELCLQQNKQNIDIILAMDQHRNYKNLLISLCDSVVCLKADETCPDCCFIEDTLISIDGINIITNPGAQTRKLETVAVKKYLELASIPFVEILNSPIQSTMIILTKEASAKIPIIDGGDVLVVNNDVFIGLTKRTNELGIEKVKQILGDKYNVYTIKVESLHLKSVVTKLEHDTLIISDCSIGNNVMKQICALTVKYNFILVSNQVCSNVLRIKNHLVIQDGFPECENIFVDICYKYNLILHKLNMSEFIKADGALTCCSVFLT